MDTDENRLLNAVRKAIPALATLAVLGFAIVGFISVARGLASPGLKSAIIGIFSRPANEEISLEAEPQPAVSAKPFELRWTHRNKSENGSYELAYPCNGHLEIATAAGALIPCNSPFPLSATTSTALIPYLDAEAPVNIALSVGFVPNGEERKSVSGSATIIISPAGGPKDAPTPPPTVKSAPAPSPTPQPPPQPAPTPQPTPTPAPGASDLAVRIIDVGIIDEAANTFTPATSVGPTQRAAVIFDVRNIGTARSERWKFSATLPTLGGFYSSETQPALAPGDGIRFTIAFGDLAKTGPNQAVFTIDPQNEIKDANRQNDSASATVNRGY